MYNLILLVLCLLISSLSVSQTEYGISETFKGDFSAAVITEGNGQGDMYLIVDKDKQTQALMFKPEKRRHEFVKFLVASFKKYEEWLEIAEKNNVDDLNKTIDMTSANDGVAFKYGEWHWSNRTPVVSKIYIKGGIKIFALVIPKASSKSNQYIKSEGCVLQFTDKSQIESLINLFSTGVIYLFIYTTNQKENLFKS